MALGITRAATIKFFVLAVAIGFWFSTGHVLWVDYLKSIHGIDNMETESAGAMIDLGVAWIVARVLSRQVKNTK